MDFLALQTEVNRLIQKVDDVFWTAQEVKDAINRAYQEFCDTSGWLRGYTVLALPANASTMSTPVAGSGAGELAAALSGDAASNLAPLASYQYAATYLDSMGHESAATSAVTVTQAASVFKVSVTMPYRVADGSISARRLYRRTKLPGDADYGPWRFLVEVTGNAAHTETDDSKDPLLPAYTFRPGTASWPLPSDLMRISGVYWDGRELYLTSEPDLGEDGTWHTRTGTPYAYLLETTGATTITLYPRPTTQGNLLIHYVSAPTTLSGDTDTPSLPLRYHPALAYHAAWSLLMSNFDSLEMEKAKTLYQFYADLVTRAQDEAQENFTKGEERVIPYRHL